MEKPFARIADRIALQIAEGDLPVGARLAPQRIFAYEEGIAVSTASRVYEELRRRGLVSGEIGRGTYVTSRFTPLEPSLQEPTGAEIDLEIVFRLDDTSRNLIFDNAAELFDQSPAQDAVGPPSVKGPEDARHAVADLLTCDGFGPEPDQILLAGNGKSALLAALSAIAPRGGRIAIEALTYPFMISAAELLGVELIPLPVDDQGLVPEALDELAARGLNGVYMQPTLHNPLGTTMSPERRARMAEILRRHDLTAIEDQVYGFLKVSRPIAALAPDHVILVDSLSKRLMPGLSLGFLIAPARCHEAISRSLRTGSWTAPSLSVALGRHWIESGVVHRVEQKKRDDARRMFAIAQETLSGIAFRSAPEALHGWIELPYDWRGEAFATACAQIGIAVTPGRAFAVVPGNAPSAVRIAYATSNFATWRHALSEMARIALAGPEVIRDR